MLGLEEKKEGRSRSLSPFRNMGRMRTHERIRISLVAFVIVALWYTYWLHLKYLDALVSTSKYEHIASLPREVAQNSTLGFQKILALSKSPSWRSRGLIAAANHTELKIEIPPQPFITPEMIEAFSKIGGPEVNGHPKTGSAHAWLAHLDLLRYAVSSNLDTVLILEDDVDWDVNVKKQMALISDNVRLFHNVSTEDKSPYGRAWDLLWLGHCGEHTDSGTKRLEYPDPTVPSVAQYIGWSKKWLPALVPGNRAIQNGINPVCTFSYAVTRHGAQRLLDFAGKGGNEAFDIRLLDGCKHSHLNCVTVQPEIMHHYAPPKELGYTSLVKQEDGKSGQSEDEKKFEGVMGGTENILESARCSAIWNRTCLKRES